MASVKLPAVDMEAMGAGDPGAFTLAVAACAAHWLSMSGSHIALPLHALHVAREEGAAKAGLMGAAMDLRDLLAQSPDGRQALRDFGFEPFLQNVESE